MTDESRKLMFSISRRLQAVPPADAQEILRRLAMLFGVLTISEGSRE